MKSVRTIGIIIISTVLFAGLFHVADAQLDNNVIALSLMILLLCVFADLKEFNFWGLRGKKEEIEKNLDALKGKDVLVEGKLPKITKTKLEKARQDTYLQPDPQATFLQLSYEVRRLLLVMLNVVRGEKVPSETHLKDANYELYKKGVISFDGFNQIEQLRIIRNELLYGNPTNVSEESLKKAIELAEHVYEDLKAWIDYPRK